MHKRSPRGYQISQAIVTACDTEDFSPARLQNQDIGPRCRVRCWLAWCAPEGQWREHWMRLEKPWCRRDMIHDMLILICIPFNHFRCSVCSLCMFAL